MQTQGRYISRTQRDAAIMIRREPIIYETGDPAASNALNAGQREAYEENGFLFMPELFSSEEVDYLQRELDTLRNDPANAGREEVVAEQKSGDVRSVFNVHRSNPAFSNLVRDPRVLNVAREILGSEVYIHQSRINYKPGFHGKEFYWHSDFETWHSEDGMPNMRAVSCSILLTDNTESNGALMLISGSHRHYVGCAGETPSDHYKSSLKKQEIGVPDEDLLRYLSEIGGGLEAGTGKAGSVIFFDCNTMHGSNSNITPDPRSNVFFVYNSIDNQLHTPQAGLDPRPEFLAARQDIQQLNPEPLIIP